MENAARAGIATLRQVRQSARQCIAAWQALEVAFETNNETPPMGRVSDLLDEIVDIADRYAGSEVAEIDTETPEATAEQPQAQGAAGGRITTRETALRTLEEVAEFFHRTEPHSPLAYTLREAVRRARLTWPELLEEIVPDFDTRTAILSSLGIRPPPPPE